jgi:hypothetical protein
MDYSAYRSLTVGMQQPRPLVSWTPVTERPREFAEALMGYACIASNAGFKGLVVTVDEVEVDDALYTNAKWEKLRQFVVAMCDELGRDEPLPGGLALFFASVGDDNTLEDQVIDRIVEATGGDSFRLGTWSTEDLHNLAVAISKMYGDAYGVDVEYDASAVDRVWRTLADQELSEAGLIRAYIRVYLNILDVSHGPPAVQ